MNINSCWSAGCSGGSSDQPDFYLNPQYRLTVHAACEFHSQMFYPIDVRGSISIVPCKDNINMPGASEIPDRVDYIAEGDVIASSGPYRIGYSHCSAVLPPGPYNVIFSNYNPKMLGSFKALCASSSSSFTLREVPPEGHGLHFNKIDGSWKVHDGTAAGCSNFGNYTNNPIHEIALAFNSHVNSICLCARLLVPSCSSIALNLSIYIQPDENEQASVTNLIRKGPKSAFSTSNSGVYTNRPSGVKIPMTTIQRNQFPQLSSTRSLKLLLVPSTFASMMEKDYVINIYSSSDLLKTSIIVK